ncbi:hypothetical protein M422DRAFT_269901 [Sphaerobolus stellatus SS14]|uniref:Unplaced genomic scaffold SPHSTscaffold_223, whole genome shotgun sequence n=1 Tax=Sphaerobolus stellatus (strain SS14) TaxID=990650 RepID=A0A0C9UTZ0_SPHS4|nr:hypothetical protein M422DRAFT_269901 [Sphaerobolus stellatus SS14]
MLSLPKRMAPMLEPPPSTAASSILTPHAGIPSTSIDSILKNLHTLILSITFPKMKNAKNCSIPLETLHEVRSLIQLSSIKEHTAGMTWFCQPGEHDRFVPLRTALKTASKTQSIDRFEDTKVLTLQFASKTSEEGYKRRWASINDRHPANARAINDRHPPASGPMREPDAGH